MYSRILYLLLLSSNEMRRVHIRTHRTLFSDSDLITVNRNHDRVKLILRWIPNDNLLPYFKIMRHAQLHTNGLNIILLSIMVENHNLVINIL